MQINNNNIKQENFYEKSKKILNSSKIRFLLGNVTGFSGIRSVVGVLGYLLSNKHNLSDLIKECIINGVKLSVVDQIFIRDNFLFFEYKFPFCWYIGFFWLLSCPDLRCKKNTKSKKINKLFEIINNFFKDKCNDNFCRIKRLDFKNLVLPDRLENKKVESEFVWITDHFDGLFLFELLDICLFDYYSAIGKFGSKSKQEFYQELIKENPENLYFDGGLELSENITFESQVNFLKEQNYYPTFFFVDASGYKIKHLCTCFVVYDKNKEIKFFLWGDSCANKQFLVLSKEAGLKKLKKQNKILSGKYTRGDIVEKYFVPELKY